MSASEPSDSDWRASSPPAPPVSPRKRRRSSSADSGRRRKRVTLPTPYNDAYRLLYNDFVHTVTGHRHGSAAPALTTSQLGATVWTATEKEAFFSAVDRLGRDHLPGIAAAVGSKSILEIRHFLLLLQDAYTDRAGKRDISLADIPAASEIGFVCERHLDAAGDTLAVKQERFEAAQEQKRHGEHWLITSELADEIEVAAKGLRASVPVEGKDDQDRLDGPTDSPLLQEIPEAKLIIPKSFLELSRNLFMNPSSDTSYPWPHWQDLVSEIAPEPCMYRTALRDFHTLVLSLTKRIMQAALIQATSRIRAQGWRAKKGVKLFVRSRDVHTAVDLLGVRGSRRRFFRGVPRRCRLRVIDGKYRKTQVLSWDEVERILDAAENRSTPLDSDTDAESRGARAEQPEFKLRAARSGTPLPPVRQASFVDSADDQAQDNVESPLGEGDSDIFQTLDDSLESYDAYADVAEESTYSSGEEELEGLEAFDREVSRLEECRLWAVIGNAPPEDQEVRPESGFEQLVRKIPRRRNRAEGDEWRTWTQYHPEWEEMRSRIPETKFTANRKSPSPSQFLGLAPDYETDYATETGLSSGGDRKSGKKLSIRTVEELPLRDSRSYAALRGRQSGSAERDVGLDVSEDEAEIPAQSIEEVNEDASGLSIVEDDAEDAMQWD
jgi:RNA polymerase I-specific transcription initiation factor RRN5